MPTKKQFKKNTKKDIKNKKRGLVAQPTKFILHISKCGTDTFCTFYKKIEHDNPVILGLHGVKIMSEGLAPKESNPLFQYLLACAILKGLQFDEKRLPDDIKNIADRIKGLSLKDVKGGEKDGKER